MNREKEFNLKFIKIKDRFGIINYYCDGFSDDNRSLFIANVIEAHDDSSLTKALLTRIESVENREKQDDDFWQPDSLPDGFRCFIDPSEIKIGKDYNYTLPLTTFKELILEWLEFQNS